MRASESASRSVTETDSPSKALALICMLYTSVPADCCTAKGSEVQLRDSARAVLQTPCEGVLRKVPVTPT